ncbi:hypothetical protein [Halobacillus litoralis]|uniref:hypothetical protein n=1 Tax=Halobacillus litoralis TaxID=45668 RepID=UPI001CD2F7D9|nr:hypothetical protein [Halobacillus litoralis]MCA1021522.1 hypothetical protein [Halobacillus litoralis]
MKFKVAAKLITGEVVPLQIKEDTLEAALSKAQKSYNAVEVWEWEQKDVKRDPVDHEKKYWSRSHHFMTKSVKNGAGHIKIFA